MVSLNAKGTLVAGILAGIGASVCCVGPLALVSLGIGGAWIANLTAFEPYRPLFIGMTLIFFSLAFRQLYLVPQACATGTSCADPQTNVRQRRVFWLAAVPVVGLLAIPWLAPLFY